MTFNFRRFKNKKKWKPYECATLSFHISQPMTLITSFNLISISFYCLETKKTYSLLPFSISRYERHINTVIEDVLQEYFNNGSSAAYLAEEPAPSSWTIRRWIAKFSSKLDDLRQKVENLQPRLISGGNRANNRRPNILSLSNGVF